MELEHVRARERGWVDVTPPVDTMVSGQRMLLMAAIQADDGSSGTTFASKTVHWLRRRLCNALHGPVEGVDLATACAHRYHDIRYTDAAAAAFREGVVWRQFRDGKVSFRPAAD
jgi:hypothetical protein